MSASLPEDVVDVAIEASIMVAEFADDFVKHRPDPLQFSPPGVRCQGVGKAAGTGCDLLGKVRVVEPAGADPLAIELVQRDPRLRVLKHGSRFGRDLLFGGQLVATGRIEPQTAAELAKSLGIRVYTVGVASKGRAPIPPQDLIGPGRYHDRHA